MKVALVTGVSGQDGSFMADFLLEKGYKVYGMERRASVKNRENTRHLIGNPNFEFIIGDLSDQNSLLLLSLLDLLPLYTFLYTAYNVLVVYVLILRENSYLPIIYPVLFLSLLLSLGTLLDYEIRISQTGSGLSTVY